MKTVTLWTDTVNISNNGDNCVYGVCFSPDGSEMVAAVGLRLIVYDVSKGKSVNIIKDGHKGPVFSVSYSNEGKMFASGSQDKSVIVWTPQGQGIVKYTHSESVQCVVFNPVRELLLSCSLSDFGIWTEEKKNVSKSKVSSRITIAAWNSEGTLFALGLYSGIISLRTPACDELFKIERSSPVWAICWAPYGDGEMFVVGDWAQTLSFYSIEGKEVVKERQLGFDPMTLLYVPSSRDTKFIIVMGANRAGVVYTLDGIKIATLLEQNAWIWCAVLRPHTPSSSQIVIGTGGGVVGFYELQILIVHALFKSLYAFRVNMTDVKVQNLDEGLQVVMKCRDVIKKVAISKRALSVQLTDKVLIYVREDSEFKYRLSDLISSSFECSLLVMCNEYLIACQDKKLQSFKFNGTRVREWNLTSHIRYIRAVGGSNDGAQILLAGLKDGQVVKIFLDNLFPVSLVKVPLSVRCLDLNYSHSKLAVVDDSLTLYVYDLVKNELLFTEPHAITVFWNSLASDLLAFSSLSSLNIKANGYKSYTEKSSGFVVGFNGRRVFVMSDSCVSSFETSLSIPVRQYAEDGKYEEAYKLACLGVEERDLTYLGHIAIQNLEFHLAKKIFSKLNKIQIVKLIKESEKKILNGELKNGILLGDVLAYEGNYAEAAKIYKENKEEHRAVAMYADLRMFDMAQEYLTNSESKEKVELMRKKAEWAVKVGEFRVGAEMYLAAGEKVKAIQLMEANSWTDMLLELAPKLTQNESEALSACADALLKLGQVSVAGDLFRRFGALDRVLKLYVDGGEWDEVFSLIKKHGELRESGYLAYAQYLAEEDRFSEAQTAFHEAGAPEEALRVLFNLADNARTENRYGDLSYYHWILSQQYLDMGNTVDKETIIFMNNFNDKTQVTLLELLKLCITSAIHSKNFKTLDTMFYNSHNSILDMENRVDNEEDRASILDEFEDHYRRAVMYFCYSSIYSYIDQPFTPFMPDSLFNISRYLMLELISDYDLPVPKFHLLYTLAKQGRSLEAYKLSRHTLLKIQSVRVPENLESCLESLISASKADPHSDNPELLPHCFRCSTSNPLLNPNGNSCINCFHPFIYSFPTFEVLPLIQFDLEEGISDDEALSLIGSHIGLSSSNKPIEKKSKEEPQDLTAGQMRKRHWLERKVSNTDILEFGSGDNSTYNSDEDDEEGIKGFEPVEDIFGSGSTDVYDKNKGFVPNVIGRNELRKLDPREVIVCKWRKPLRYKFYKNCIPETPIISCTSCWMLFHSDDFVSQMLSKGSCPFCRTVTGASKDAEL